MKRDLAIAAALVAATWAVYAQTLGFPFLEWDDSTYVTRNALVNAGIGLDSLRQAFLNRTEALNWLPVTAISYMIDTTLFGIDPVVFHATNVALHAIDAVLVYALLRSLTSAVWPSAIAAALFALHPLRVESVAWVSCRKDVLSAAFGLLALIAHVRYARRGSLRAYAATFACTVAALLAKATWASLPALFLLLDFWPLRRFGPSAPEGGAFPAPAAPRASAWRLIAEKLPFAAVAAGAVFVTSVFQVPNHRDLPLDDRLVHALVSYAWYVWKTLWPAHLSPHYPHPYLTGGGVPWTGAQIALAALLIAGLTALALRFVRRGYPLVGWLWFLGTLVPVVGFTQYGTQGMADRYTHLPHVGLFLAAAFGGWELVVPRLRSVAARRIAAAAVAAVLIAMGSASFAQARAWRDMGSLFTYALRVMPRDAVIQLANANLALEAGRFDDALRHGKTALDLHPGFHRARRVLAVVLTRRAAAMPALPEPDFLLDGGPSDAFVHEALAEIAAARGDWETALAHARAALATEPDSIRALWQLAVLFFDRGDAAGARDALQRIVALDPDSNEAREALAGAERAPAVPR